MKSTNLLFTFFLSSVLLANGCGRNEHSLKDSGEYQVRNDLAVADALVLSYQQVFLFRSISVGESQSSTCDLYAKDYQAKAGVTVLPNSLKVTFDEPVRHCASRNAIKQCETHQYVYTFYCRYQMDRT